MFPLSCKSGEEGNASPDAACSPFSSKEEGDMGWSWADGGTIHNMVTPDGRPMHVQFGMLLSGRG